MYKILFIDTETTGKCDLRTPYTEETLQTTWPYITELAFRVEEYSKSDLSFLRKTVDVDWLIIPNYPREVYSQEAEEITGISYSELQEKGSYITSSLQHFVQVLNEVDFVVAHNATFDLKVIKAELLRHGIDQHLRIIPWVDTMFHGTPVCGLKTSKNRPKWPSLTELYQHFYNKIPDSTHRAHSDVQTLRDCFTGLIKVGELSPERMDLKIKKHVSSAK